MRFLQIHVFIVFLTFAEEHLGRSESENVGDRYEAIGRMQEEHLLKPGWYNHFSKEHPISTPWRGERDDFHLRHRKGSYHRHPEDKYDQDSDHERLSHRHRKSHQHRDKHRHIHRKDASNSERDNAGNVHEFRVKNTNFEDEAGFHAKHTKHRKSKKMLWVSNIFADSKIQKPQPSCDCSKCQASAIPTPVIPKSKLQSDQPEMAAASSFEFNSQHASAPQQNIVEPGLSRLTPQKSAPSPQRVVKSGVQLGMHLKRRRAASIDALKDADILEFGSRNYQAEEKVSTPVCPDCCKEKQKGWAKPENAVAVGKKQLKKGYHIEEP